MSITMTGEEALSLMRDMMCSDPENHNMEAMLHAHRTNDDMILVPLTMEDPATGLNMHPTDCLGVTVRLFYENNWEIAWACMFSDSYGFHAPKGDEDMARGLPRGTLEERFLLGDPNVYETTMATMAHRDGTFFYASQPYRRDPITRLIVEWNEPSIETGDDGQISGQVIKLLRQMVRPHLASTN